VRFATGKPFDAAAAERVFQWLLSEPGRASIVGNEIRSLVAVHTRGSHELVLETRQPDPILPNRLIAVMMVEPDAWESLGVKGLAVGEAYTLAQLEDPAGRRFRLPRDCEAGRRQSVVAQLREAVEDMLPDLSAGQPCGCERVAKGRWQ
jgi:peptide/nickel transport system substrate-binding protein